jgi:hypothetical protein
MISVDYFRYVLDGVRLKDGGATVTFQTVHYSHYQYVESMFDLEQVLETAEKYLEDHYGKVLILDKHVITLDNWNKLKSSVDKPGLVAIKKEVLQ